MVMTSVTAVGYGTAINTDANDGSDTVGTLRYTSFDSRSIRTLHGMILVKNSNSGICHGDSGGPLFEGNPASAKNIVVGLNNFALPFPKTFWQEVHWYLAEKSNSLNDYSDAYPDQDLCVGVNGFVDVASHRAWIIKAAASLGVVIQ
jgi:hypothetical protein